MEAKTFVHNYHLKPGYVSRPAPTYFEDIDDGVVWQPDVYRLLGDLARALNCHRILDLGCGRARKLTALFPEFEIVGADVGANLSYCVSSYGFGTWTAVDLESPEPFALQGYADASTAIVCADVIEHLVDPSGLMALVRDLLVSSSFALISTPERDKTHGNQHAGPPPNPSHVREWNLEELADYASASGLDVAFAGLTASHTYTFPLATSLLLVCGRRLTTADRQNLTSACDAQLARYAQEREGAAQP